MYKRVKGSWTKHLDFMILDLVCYEVAFMVAYMVRHGFSVPYEVAIYRHMSILIIFIDICLVFFMESYKNILRRGYLQEFKATVSLATMLVLLLFFYMFLTRSSDMFSRTVLLVFWGLTIGISYVARLILKSIVRKHLESNGDWRSIIAITSNELAKETIENFKERAYRDYRITGVIVPDQDMVGRSFLGVPVVAYLDCAIEYMRSNVVDEVFINLPPEEKLPQELMDACVAMGITTHLNLLQASRTGGKKVVEKLGSYTVLTSSIQMASPRQLFFKRALDICGGIVGCIFTGVIFLFVAPVIKIQSPGPVFFKQERVGKSGRKFKLYKFRSMYVDAEERKKELMAQNEMDGFMFKMKDDPRIFPFGHFLRKSSLDEFPQFWNVLKGDMSLVGNCYIIGTTKKNPVFSSVCPIG
ncbi:sugar transferase [Hespellia stercorisuis]|uniref:CoA-binding domain-containing protein n=1 Tax=Hespellia stercorisuis DSM 15480 TaxID=1121950 RepID=A0A1M6TEV1_9FIRM|nr:sugar transferase [Hespellia stercorisuis]SHK55481.1 CoA-binding domain-containing protein [Hespellia stercorisuis DSM 15480]